MTFVPIWTDVAVERLKALHAEKLTFSQIANELSAEFKKTITRNACIGKAGRLGLVTTRRPGFNGINCENRAERMFVRKRRRSPSVPLPAEVETAAEPRHIEFQALQIGLCKFPYGEGPFTFCGCDAVAGKPYCVAHTAICEGRPRETAEEVVTRRRRFNFQLKLEVVAA